MRKIKFDHAQLRDMAVSKAPTEDSKESFPLPVNLICVITIRPDRWASFNDRMGSWHAMVTKLDGTDGRRIDRSDWIRRGLIDKDCKLRRGQLGCYDSHVRVWKKMRADKVGRMLICEDDAGLFNNAVTTAYLKQLETETRRIDYDMLMLGHHCRGENARVSRNVEQAPDTVGLFAYVLTLRGAEKLLKMQLVPYKVPIDNLISSFIKKANLRIVRATPAVCFVVPITCSDTINIL